MEKMIALRSLYRSARARSCRILSGFHHHDEQLRQYSSRSFFPQSPSHPAAPPTLRSSDCRHLLSMGIRNKRFFSEDLSHLPDIKDPEIKNVFKDFMAADWGEIPDSLFRDAKKALSKNTDDKAGKEILTNVVRAAEAIEEFIGTLTTLRMSIDDLLGLSGENVKPLPEVHSSALQTAYERYTAYLDAFGPDEVYLKKKVETELGTRMIHLKMRCGGIGSKWGKVTVLGTSGISGSYIEQRSR